MKLLTKFDGLKCKDITKNIPINLNVTFAGKKINYPKTGLNFYWTKETSPELTGPASLFMIFSVFNGMQVQPLKSRLKCPGTTQPYYLNGIRLLHVNQEIKDQSCGDYCHFGNRHPTLSSQL